MRSYKQAVCMECGNKMKNLNWWDAKEWFYKNMGCTITETPNSKEYFRCVHCSTVMPENEVRMATCYFPYRSTTFKIWDGPDIENSLGVFHMTAEKFYCDNSFKFRARQVGVRYQDKLIHVEPNVDRLRLVKSPLEVTGYQWTNQDPTNATRIYAQEEIKLKTWAMPYHGSIAWLKRVYNDAQDELRRL